MRSKFPLNLQVSIIHVAILSYFQIIPRDLLDNVGPLSSELISSVIVEASTALNHVHQTMVKETKKRRAYIKSDEKIDIRIGKYLSAERDKHH